MTYSLPKALPLLGLLCWACAAAGFDGYLRLEGVDGESTDSNHPKWIQIEALSQGAAPATTPGFSDLCLNKKVDSSSPVLAQSLARGKRFAFATLDLVTTDANRVRFYQIGLSNVVVTSVSTSGSAGDIRPGEAVCLRYARIGWNYTEVDARGLPVGNINAWWDLVLNIGGSNLQTPFRVAATQLDASTLTLSWSARAGVTYNILGSQTVDGTYQLVQSVTPSADGMTSVPVSISSGPEFFRVQQ